MSIDRNYSRLKGICVCSDSAPSFSLDSFLGGDFEIADVDDNETFSLQSAPGDNVEEGMNAVSPPNQCQGLRRG